MSLTFGQYIIRRRTELNMSQKKLASLIFKEGGGSISAQYLNDIEHDRRKPREDYIIRELAKALKTEEEVLYYLSEGYPLDARSKSDNPERIIKAFTAFRRALKDDSKDKS